MKKPTPAERKRKKDVDTLVSMCKALHAEFSLIAKWAQSGNLENLYKCVEWDLEKYCAEVQELAGSIVEAELDAVAEEVASASPWADYDEKTVLCFEILRLRKELANVGK